MDGREWYKKEKIGRSGKKIKASAINPRQGEMLVNIWTVRNEW